MARTDLKTRKPLGATIKIELFDALKQHSEETMIPMSKILDKAIEQYLNSVNK